MNLFAYLIGNVFGTFLVMMFVLWWQWKPLTVWMRKQTFNGLLGHFE